MDTTSAETIRATLGSLLTGLSSAIEALQVENRALANDCARLAFDIEVAGIALEEADRRSARLDAILTALPPLPALPDPAELAEWRMRVVREARSLANHLIQDANLTAAQIPVEDFSYLDANFNEGSWLDEIQPEAESGQGANSSIPVWAYTTGPFPVIAFTPFGSDWADEEDTELGSDSGTIRPIQDVSNGPTTGALPELVDRAVLFGHTTRVGMLGTELAPARIEQKQGRVASNTWRAFLSEICALITLLPVTALSVYTMLQLFAGTTPGHLLAYLLVGLISSAILAPILGVAGGFENLHARGSAALAVTIVDVVWFALGMVLILIEPAWLAPGAAFMLLGGAAMIARGTYRLK